MCGSPRAVFVLALRFRVRLHVRLHVVGPRRLCAHGALSKDELCTLARGEACTDGAEQRAADPWRGPGTPNERRGACVFARAGAELGQQSS